MALELLPLLAVQRELLHTARGFERFRQYLEVMLDERGEVVLPLAAFNPMSKPHVAVLLDSLIAMGAEDVARAALAEATARLGAATLALRVGLVVVDDALGGWTNRFLTDMDHRFGGSGELKRGFSTAYAWTGEETTPAMIRTETLGAVYRHCYKRLHGLPQTLRAMLMLEGLMSVFADAAIEREPAEVGKTRAILARHLDDTARPTVFACFYGDEAAASVGYPPLGVPPWGGFAVAAAAARAQRWEPLRAIATPPELPTLALG